MADRPRIRVGKYYNTTLIHPEHLVLAFLLAAMAVLLLYISLYDPSVIPLENDSLLRVAIIMLGAFMVIGAIVAVYLAFIIQIETIFLEGGCCGITDRKVHCRGGCNRCIIAQQYISDINRKGPLDKE